MGTEPGSGAELYFMVLDLNFWKIRIRYEWYGAIECFESMAEMGTEPDSES